MTAPYKKRARHSYSKNKKLSNRTERRREHQEIADQLRVKNRPMKKICKKTTKERQILRKIRDIRFALKISGGKSIF